MEWDYIQQHFLTFLAHLKSYFYFSEHSNFNLIQSHPSRGEEKQTKNPYPLRNQTHFIQSQCLDNRLDVDCLYKKSQALKDKCECASRGGCQGWHLTAYLLVQVPSEFPKACGVYYIHADLGFLTNAAEKRTFSMCKQTRAGCKSY